MTNTMKKELIVSILAVSFAYSICAQEKIIIEKAEDLPKHSYQLKLTTLTELIGDEEQIRELENAVFKDLEADLDKYEFTDKSILKGYFDNFSTIALL